MDDRELLKQADEFLEITRPTSLALASEVSLVYKMKERLEELTADKEPQSIVWEPKVSEEYHCVSTHRVVWLDYYDGHTDKLRLDYHNVYKTRELAEKAAAYQSRYNMVLQAVLNLEPDQVVDWSDVDQLKYTVYFDHELGIWDSTYGHVHDNGYPPLTDEKNIQPLLDYLNAKEKENG